MLSAVTTKKYLNGKNRINNKDIISKRIILAILNSSLSKALKTIPRMPKNELRPKTIRCLTLILSIKVKLAIIRTNDKYKNPHVIISITSFSKKWNKLDKAKYPINENDNTDTKDISKALVLLSIINTNSATAPRTPIPFTIKVKTFSHLFSSIKTSIKDILH